MSRKRKNKSSTNSGLDYEQVVKEVTKAQLATRDIPRIVQEQIKKGWKQLPNTDPTRSPKSWFQDPLSLQYSLGYKDRKFSLTYDTLNRVANQLSVISAIINTRIAQVSAFCQPYRWTKSLGFAIKHKDPDHPTTPAELAFIKELEQFILNCGRAEKNPYTRVKRDDFENFIRKVLRDSLVLDALAVEVVPDKLGIPYEFYAVDASTIRISADNRYTGTNSSYTSRGGFVPSMPSRFQNLYEGAEYGKDSRIDYVQVINGQIENVYANTDFLKQGDSCLALGIRNPRTGIYTAEYGYSELESLISIVTAHLFAEQYNRNFFTQGSQPKGLLNFKGDAFTPEMLENFRRQWLAQASGVENSHKMPVFQSEGMEWVDLNKSNQEMEFGKWVEYLLKLTTAVYLIDPAEINFDMHGGQSQQPLFESSQEWKLKASRDKGLKPLLRFLAKFINKHIIDKIDDHFTFEFVGLDELTEEEKHEMLIEQISSYMTLNEARRQLDLPDLPHGDVPMNSVYLAAMQANQQQQMMDQQAQQPQPVDNTQGSANLNAQTPPNSGNISGEPKYTNNFKPEGQLS